MANSTTNINTQQTQTFGFNIHAVNRKDNKFQRIELNAAGTPYSFLDFTQSNKFSLKEGTELDYSLKLLSIETNFEPEDLANFFFIQETCSVASKLIISNKNLFLDFLTNLSYEEVKRASTVGVTVGYLEVTEVNDYEGTQSTGLTLTNQEGTMELELILNDEQQQITEMFFNGSARSYKEVQAVTMIESSFALAS